MIHMAVGKAVEGVDGRLLRLAIMSLGGILSATLSMAAGQAWVPDGDSQGIEGYAAAGYWETATRKCTEAIDSKGDAAWLRMTRARLLLAHNRPDEALLDLKVVRERWPRTDTSALVCQAYYLMGDKARTSEAFAEANSRSLARSGVEWAKGYELIGQFAKAEQARLAIIASARASQAYREHMRLAMSYERHDEGKKGIEQLAKAARIMQNSQVTSPFADHDLLHLVLLGRCRQKSGDINGALAAYVSAAKLGAGRECGRETTTLYDLSMLDAIGICHSLGVHDKVRQHIERALVAEVRPDQEEVARSNYARGLVWLYCGLCPAHEFEAHVEHTKTTAPNSDLVKVAPRYLATYYTLKEAGALPLDGTKDRTTALPRLAFTHPAAIDRQPRESSLTPNSYPALTGNTWLLPAIGAVAGVALTAVLGWLLVRRRRAR